MNGGICHINLANGFRDGARQSELLVRGLAKWGIEQILVARSGQPLASRLNDVAGLTVHEANGIAGAFSATSGASLIHAHEPLGWRAMAHPESTPVLRVRPRL